MYDYETHIEGTISDIILTSLADKGLRVKLLRKKDIHDQKLGNIVSNLRRQYNTAREVLYTPLNWDHKKAFSVVKNIGSTTKDLREKTGGDLLIFVDYVGAIKTTGARTLDFATSLILGSTAVKDADNSSIVIGIVDAKSGDVLWMNLRVIQKDLYDCAFDNFSDQHKIEKKTLTELITQTLVPFTY